MAHTWKLRLRAARDHAGREIAGRQYRYYECGKCHAERHNELERGRWRTYYVERSTGLVKDRAGECPADNPVDPGQLDLFSSI